MSKITKTKEFVEFLLKLAGLEFKKIEVIKRRRPGWDIYVVMDEDSPREFVERVLESRDFITIEIKGAKIKSTRSEEELLYFETLMITFEPDGEISITPMDEITAYREEEIIEKISEMIRIIDGIIKIIRKIKEIFQYYF